MEVTDVRLLIRLAIDLHDHRQDPPAAAMLLLSRLCHITGAAAAVIGTAELRDGKPHLRLSQTFLQSRNGQAAKASGLIHRPDALLHAAWEVAMDKPSRIVHPTTLLHPQPLGRSKRHSDRTARQFMGLGQGLYSLLPTGRDEAGVLSLHQSRGGHRAWTKREVLMIDLLHPELTWLYSTPPTTAGSTDAVHPTLPPRQQQTLRLLLRGLSEKQIAASLGLSIHTVHVYVKSIYRAFRITSRAELLAKWVKA